ncbi:MAG: hypothetical protein FWD56_04130 [Bacteroidales bacterium]|nr:hypothetical protein [Bacteroidales bacterium]
MKKTLALVFMVGMLMLIGCGGSGGSGSGKIKGETYSTELMSVLVPNGWKAFPYYKSGGTDPLPNTVGIHKGAKTMFEQMSTPGIVINYYEEAKYVMKPNKDWYEDVVEMKPFALGNYEWEGFTGVSYGNPVAIIWTTNGVEMFQLNIFLKMYDKEIAYEDADVQAIIASVSIP